MEFLTRKMGPLPTWAWAAIIVGGFVVYRLRKQSAAATGTDLYGGQLNPENNAGYPGNGALSPDSLLPVSAISQTNGGTSTDPNQPFSSSSGPTGTYYTPGAPAPTAGTSGSGPGGEQRVNLPGSSPASAPSQSVAIGGLSGGTGFVR